MSYRLMRLVVFFDLPMVSAKDSREYRLFRKFLLNNGFIMMQESVYSKLLINNNSSALLKNKIRKNLPPAGLVQMLEVTERQFASIEFLVGKGQSKVVDSTDRVVVL